MDANDWNQAAAIAQIAQSFIALGASVTALVLANQWRKQVLFTKKVDLAEEALITMYQFKDFIQLSRRTAMLEYYGSCGRAEVAEYVKELDRKINSNPLWEKMHAMCVRLKIHLGGDSDSISRKLSHLKAEFYLAVNLLDLEDTDDEKQRENWRRAREVLESKDGDSIEKRLDGMVTILESLCFPYLKNV